MPVIAKIGAEGVIAIGCEDGRGLAVKVAGRRPARARPRCRVGGRRAARLPVDAGPLAALAAPAVRNSRDEVVGRLSVAASS